MICDRTRIGVGWLLLFAVSIVVLGVSTSEAGQPGKRNLDCEGCPIMVVLPTGYFELGSTPGERDWAVRQGGKSEWYADEYPRVSVHISREIWMSETEVTVGQFRDFVNATGHDADGKCRYLDETDHEFKQGASRTWRDPGFRQADDHPVVCVNWHDAQSYVRWLSRKTGEAYRLPTEAEFEYAAKAGTDTMRYWGNDGSNTELCAYANAADQSLKHLFGGSADYAPCDDGYVFTNPVSGKGKNAFGLYGALGNVWEWVQDCYAKDVYQNLQDQYPAPVTQSNMNRKGACARVLRDGSWLTFPWIIRAAFRVRDAASYRSNDLGFRITRTHSP